MECHGKVLNLVFASSSFNASTPSAAAANHGKSSSYEVKLRSFTVVFSSASMSEYILRSSRHIFGAVEFAAGYFGNFAQVDSSTLLRMSPA